MDKQKAFEVEYKRSVETDAEALVSRVMRRADQKDYQTDIYLDDVLREARKIFQEMLTKENF